MKERPIVDMTLGIGAQAMAVLHVLNQSEVGYEQVANITTRPWYNGRERGILLCVQFTYAEPALCVAVFEARSSDNIEVHHWEQQVSINIPTGWEHCDQAAYSGASHATFQCGEMHAAAQHILDGVERWVKFQETKLGAADEQRVRAHLARILTE